MSPAPAPLDEKVIFFPLNYFEPLKNLLGEFMWVNFSVLYSVPLIYVSVVAPTPYSLDCCSLYIARQYWVDRFLKVYSFFNIDLALLGPVPFHINVRISLSMSPKIPCWNFDRN